MTIPDTPENRERLRHLYFGDRAGRRVASSSSVSERPADLPVAAPDPAEVIQRAMDEPGTFCAYCARPLATEEDWKDYPEGGGEHLCWDGGDAGCTDSGTVTLRRDDVRALLAERQQDKERIAEQAEFVRAYDSLDDALDNLLDYLKLVRWSEPEDRNIKAALMWADRVAGYFGRCNVARAALAVEEDAG